MSRGADAGRAFDLSIALDPESFPELRADAVQRLMNDSWERGWDACQEAYTEALTYAGVKLPEPPEPPPGPLH